MESALAAIGGCTQLLTTVVQMVLDQSVADMAAIRNDAGAANSAALASSTHRLKGSLGTIAAAPAFQACSALNKLARAGEAAAYPMALSHLEDELGRLLPCLHTWLIHNKN